MSTSPATRAVLHQIDWQLASLVGDIKPVAKENEINIGVYRNGVCLKMKTIDTFEATEEIEGFEPGRWISQCAGKANRIVVITILDDQNVAVDSWEFR